MYVVVVVVVVAVAVTVAVADDNVITTIDQQILNDCFDKETSERRQNA